MVGWRGCGQNARTSKRPHLGRLDQRVGGRLYAAPRSPSPQLRLHTPAANRADDGLPRLLKACEGRDFADRRDAAILRLFLDTGARVPEAAGTMLPGDLDLDDQVIIVLGKAAGPGRSRSLERAHAGWL
jgi:site-specific recombinase XerC